jgi:alpha-tubulin suppressor-like RCC1 family protein
MAITAGGYHTVALMNDGSVAAWGYNGEGQTTVPIAAQSGVTAIVAGHSYTVALKNDGSVVAWGYNEWGQTTVPVAAQSGVTAIAAGVAHSVALKNDGSVVAWGKNFYGQVTGTPTRAAPYSATASPVMLGGQVLSGVTAIAAGGYHTVALKSDGSVVSWGNNGYGQVAGTPTTDSPYTATASPVTLVGQVLSGVTAIAAGTWHTVALRNNNGSVVAWGDNEEGQVTGTATTTDFP